MNTVEKKRIYFCHSNLEASMSRLLLVNSEYFKYYQKERERERGGGGVESEGEKESNAEGSQDRKWQSGREEGIHIYKDRGRKKEGC